MTDISPWHVLILIIVLAFGGLFIACGWVAAGWIAFGISIVACIWFAAANILDSSSSYFHSRAEFLQFFTAADPQARDALGLRYPALRLRMTASPLVEVEDSGVRLLYFREFLHASNPVAIVPKRTYGDKTTKRAQWELWKAWLVDCSMIYPDRTQMNETYKWINGDSYWRLVNSYVKMRVPDELTPDGDTLPDGTRPLPGYSMEGELK